VIAELVVEFLAGLAAGVFAGVTGAGGGLLLVPILVWLGLPAISAIATSNVAIVVSATSGSVTNFRRFHLPVRRVLWLAIPAVLAAPLGVALARRAPETSLLLAFAGFQLVAIALLQWRLRRVPPASGAGGADEAGAGEVGAGAGAGGAGETAAGATSDTGPHGVREDATAVGIGAGGGVLAGLFGVGGGLVMVPLQAVFLSTPVRMASRISLAVVLFASSAAVIAHVFAGTDIRWWTAAVMALGGLIGAPLGARFLHRITDVTATRIIQVTMAVVAGSFIWRALG